MAQQPISVAERIAPHDPRLAQEQVRRLYDRLTFQSLAVVLVMAITTVFFWNTAERAILLGWLAGNLIIASLRLASVYRFNRHPPPQRQLPRWGWIAALFSLAYGILWGAVAPLFMQPTDPMQVAFVCILLSGTVTGTLGTLATYLPAFIAYATPTLLCLATTLSLQEGQAMHVFGALTYAYYLITVAYAIQTNQDLKRYLLLTFRNMDLAENLKRQRDRAEQANQEKSRFLATTSHDLRQPIQALDLFMASLQHEIDGDEARQLLANMRRSHRAVSEMLDSLLDLSKLDAGVLHAAPRPVALGPLLTQLDVEFAPQATAKGITLRVRSNKATVFTDPELLLRILRNLIANAIAYTDAGGVLVGVRPAGAQRVRIEVWDTGRGIASAEQPRIFQEFYQLHNPERNRRQGLGLGLSIVSRLSKLLGHELELRSRPGRGSVFSLTLDCADSELVGQPGDNIPVMGETATGGTILIIEDDAAVREGLVRLLNRWGFDVREAWDQPSALAAIEAKEVGSPTFIITDYRLPGPANGLQTLARIRRHPAWAQTPAVILTGDTLAKDLINCEVEGVELLHKPVAPAKLRALITQRLKSD